MGLAKKKSSKSKSSKTGLKKAVGRASSALGIGGGSKGGKSRKHGPTWYANKILIEKMKRKLNKLKYGGMR